ncbi:MAG: hypothetical protein NT154_06350 [Verrucomicrobia bacterium]|nr:hypothetical protein [Verrucomicrobiota bacterium]
MKALGAFVILAAALSFAHAQTPAAATNRTLLYMTNPTNAVSISNAVKIASDLRLGMTAPDVHKYMREHGMGQTNLYSLSLDRGHTLSCPYPLSGGGSSLMLEMECSEPPESGLFGWKNPLLKGAYIQSQGANIISITLTNAP